MLSIVKNAMGLSTASILKIVGIWHFPMIVEIVLIAFFALTSGINNIVLGISSSQRMHMICRRRILVIWIFLAMFDAKSFFKK
jgi:hypothetical protein